MTPELAGFDSRRLSTILELIPDLRIAVLGDFFLDKYLEVDQSLAEFSLETGLTAHQVVGVRHSPGAAGTVVNNLVALGARNITAIGFTGDDGEGYELRQDLGGLGVDTSRLLLDPGRHTPVYLKPRYSDRPGLDGEHSRYDIKNRTPTDTVLETAMMQALEAMIPGLDLLIVMDQVEDNGCGVVTAGMVKALEGLMVPDRKLVAWVDSRRRIRAFRGLTLKMNQFELAGIPDPAPGDSVPDSLIVRELPVVEALAGKAVFATVGERGVWVGGARPTRIPAIRMEGPLDPTGAGDSFTAGVTLALATGATPAVAALLGNLVASITVRQLATTGTAKPAQLYEALDLWKEQNQ
ncbi:MAG: PfkB family carbohydrate kinase [Spirochaetota bacterium]